MPVPVPRELPADVSAFTGRHAELTELDQLLPVTTPGAGDEAPEAMVVWVVSGTAGVGKTALAVRWAHRVKGAFPDGQLYVNLRGYDPGLPVPATEALAQFLRALGVADSSVPLTEAERAARYRSIVAGKRLLVVLDNAASVEQVRPLLPGTPTVMVVVTSRDSLAGLVARDGAHRLRLDLLPTAESVVLLSRLVGDRVADDPVAAHLLATQCAGLPLALRVAAELATARPHTPLAELTCELAGLQDRLELLVAGGDPRDAIAGVFSWSYRNLSSDAAGMFRLLGLHPGPDFDAYAAAALTGAGLAHAKRLLADLARAHLTAPVPAGRATMHDLLRAYAADLAARHDGETACHAALTRLFDYYLAASAAAMDGLAPALRHRRPDPPPTAAPLPDVGEATRARAWLDKELATLATVAAHTAGHGWPTHTTRLADTISGSYLDIDHYTDGVVILRHAVAAAQSCGNDAAQARALIGLGHIHSRGGRPGQAARCLGQAIDLAASTDDRLLQARSLGASASASSLQGHYRQARERYDRARALYREVGDRLGEAVNLTNVGLLDLRQGCYHQAAGHYQQALVLLREIGHRFAEANALHNLGEAYCRQGAYEQAVTYQRQAVAVAREVGSSYIEAHALNGLADVWHRRGSYDEASTSRQQSLALFAEVGDRAGESDALNGAGETLLATGQPEQAYKCHSKALALAREAGSQREEARALARLGETCRARGEPGQAASHHEAALTLYRQIGDRGGEADALNGDGEALLAAGQAAQAQACHSAALALTDQTGDRYQQARALAGLAAACHAMGEREQARRHGEQAREVFGELGVPSVVALPTVPAVPGLAASSRLASARPSPRVGLMLVSSAGPGRAGPDPVVPEPAPPGLRFKILGPLEVCDGEAACTPTAPKVRRVFALLLLQTNQVVPTGSLIEELWGQEPPHSATTTVATYIYQLRRAFSQRQVSLGVRDWLVTAAPGYLLRVSPEQVDAHAFKALSRQGRQLLESGQPQAAADVLRRALDLWRGPALANVTTGRLLAGHAVHLEEERLRTLELRILADAELGRHHALVGELRALVAVHPLNEWLHGQLIAALSRSGRRSEALQAYRHLQALLRDELGLDPHPGLQRLHQDVLNDDLPQAPLFGLSVPSATLR